MALALVTTCLENVLTWRWFSGKRSHLALALAPLPEVLAQRTKGSPLGHGRVSLGSVVGRQGLEGDVPLHGGWSALVLKRRGGHRHRRTASRNSKPRWC
jgi:hypothetical protein